MHIFKDKKFLNLYWLFSDKFIRIPVTIFVSSLLARYLGPADLGLIVFSVSFFGIFGFLVNSGLEEILTRNLVRDPENKNLILANGLLLKFLGGILATSLALIFGSIFYSSSEFFFILIVSSSGLFYGPFIFESYFNSKYESKFIVRINLIVFLVFTVLKLYGIYLMYSIEYFLFLIPIEISIMSMSYIALTIHQGIHFSDLKFNLRILNSLLKDTLPLILSGFAVTLYMKMDQIMIKSMLGNEDLGIFSVGIRFVENVYFIPMLITSSFLPLLVEENKKSSGELNRATYILTSSTLYLCFFISFVFLFSSDFLILFLFGEQFQEAIPIFKVYSFTLVFTALGVSSSRRLLVENRQHLSLFRTISGLLLNLVLNYLWIPKFGSLGAAWASVISNAFSSFLFYGFHPSTWTIFRIQCLSFYPFPLIKYYKNLKFK